MSFVSTPYRAQATVVAYPDAGMVPQGSAPQQLYPQEWAPQPQTPFARPSTAAASFQTTSQLNGNVCGIPFRCQSQLQGNGHTFLSVPCPSELFKLRDAAIALDDALGCALFGIDEHGQPCCIRSSHEALAVTCKWLGDLLNISQRRHNTFIDAFRVRRVPFGECPDHLAKLFHDVQVGMVEARILSPNDVQDYSGLSDQERLHAMTTFLDRTGQSLAVVDPMVANRDKIIARFMEVFRMLGTQPDGQSQLVFSPAESLRDCLNKIYQMHAFVHSTGNSKMSDIIATWNRLITDSKSSNLITPEIAARLTLRQDDSKIRAMSDVVSPIVLFNGLMAIYVANVQ